MLPNMELDITLGETISLSNFQTLNMVVPAEEDFSQQLIDSDEPLSVAADLLSEECEELLARLGEAVNRRVGAHSYFCSTCSPGSPCDNAHIAIMFSGGIDSMMLAYLADQFVTKNQSIDLLNVAFETGSGGDGYDVPDRITGRRALEELPHDRAWNFVEVNDHIHTCWLVGGAGLFVPIDTSISRV